MDALFPAVLPKPCKWIAEHRAGERGNQRHIEGVNQHLKVERIEQASIVFQRKDHFDEIRIVTGQKLVPMIIRLGRKTNNTSQPTMVTITTLWNLLVFFISQYDLPTFYPVNGHFLVQRVIEVRIVFVEEFANHHHLAIFQFDNRLQRHAFVVALTHVADKSFDVVVIVDLIYAQIFRTQQNMQFCPGVTPKFT